MRGLHLTSLAPLPLLLLKLLLLVLLVGCSNADLGNVRLVNPLGASRFSSPHVALDAPRFGANAPRKIRQVNQKSTMMATNDERLWRSFLSIFISLCMCACVCVLLVQTRISQLGKQLQYHGTTTLGFVIDDGVIVAVDSRASMGDYIGSRTVKKVCAALMILPLTVLSMQTLSSFRLFPSLHTWLAPWLAARQIVRPCCDN